jgi:hypothetical protein
MNSLHFSFGIENSPFGLVGDKKSSASVVGSQKMLSAKHWLIYCHAVIGFNTGRFQKIDSCFYLCFSVCIGTICG